jgi:hypothetical protein
MSRRGIAGQGRIYGDLARGAWEIATGHRVEVRERRAGASSPAAASVAGVQGRLSMGGMNWAPDWL